MHVNQKFHSYAYSKDNLNFFISYYKMKEKKNSVKKKKQEEKKKKNKKDNIYIYYSILCFRSKNEKFSTSKNGF